MTGKWSEREAKRWLRDQKAAMQRVEEERVRFLLQLTPEESWRIYLSLQQGDGGPNRNTTEPSPLLWAMRQAVQRYTESKGKAT